MSQAWSCCASIGLQFQQLATTTRTEQLVASDLRFFAACCSVDCWLPRYLLLSFVSCTSAAMEAAPEKNVHDRNLTNPFEASCPWIFLDSSQVGSEFHFAPVGITLWPSTKRPAHGTDADGLESQLNFVLCVKEPKSV